MAERHIDQVRFKTGAFDTAARTAQLLVGIRSVPIKETAQPNSIYAGPSNSFEQLGFAFDNRGREADVKRAPARTAPCVRGQSRNAQP